jgi:hypothetical protein
MPMQSTVAPSWIRRIDDDFALINLACQLPRPQYIKHFRCSLSLHDFAKCFFLVQPRKNVRGCVLFKGRPEVALR